MGRLSLHGGVARQSGLPAYLLSMMRLTRNCLRAYADAARTVWGPRDKGWRAGGKRCVSPVVTCCPSS